MTGFAEPRTVAADIQRDGYGRPLIIPPGGGKPKPYTRVSTFAKALDDSSGLVSWASAMTLIGATRNESLVRAAIGLEYERDKRELRELVERAQALGGSKDKATEGTTLHRLTERIDTGEGIPDGIDDTTRRDLLAYVDVTAVLRPLMAETFVVIDELRVAGTFDRLADVAAHPSVPEWLHGRRVIVDLKTGSLEYAVGGFAVQLAMYARGKLYDPVTGSRAELGADPSVGLVVHLPQRTGTATLYAINLDAGWKAAQLAVAVREWRSTARLSNSRYKSPIATAVLATSAP